MNSLRRVMARHRRDERGVETIAMIIVIPVLCVLIFALLDIGLMLRARVSVESIARDTVRSAAADGGNYNKRTNTIGRRWDAVALSSMYVSGKCTQSNCSGAPTVSCRTVRSASNGAVYISDVAYKAGDLITCKVTYPYKPINSALLNGPLGMGFGKMLGPFTIQVSARAETGTQG
jgi:Flp pilus assembly protein TadG